MWFSKWYFTPFWLPVQYLPVPFLPVWPNGSKCLAVEMWSPGAIETPCTAGGMPKMSRSACWGKVRLWGWARHPRSLSMELPRICRNLGRIFSWFFCAYSSCHYLILRISVKGPVCQSMKIFWIDLGRSDLEVPHLPTFSAKEFLKWYGCFQT